MTEIKISEAKYNKAIRAQSTPVKSTIGENCQNNNPVINAIVTGINNVINPAKSLPDKTWYRATPADSINFNVPRSRSLDITSQATRRARTLMIILKISEMSNVGKIEI